MARKVLLASRLPDESTATIQAAARLAEQISGELLMVYVAVEFATLPDLQGATGADPTELREQMLRRIEADARNFLERHLPHTRAKVIIGEGDTAEAIARVAREEAVDYLVVGTDDRGTLKQVMIGSTSRQIIRHAPCPVVLIPFSS